MNLQSHSCAVTFGGAVQCWGGNYNRFPSTVVGLETGVKSIAVFHVSSFVCTFKELYCYCLGMSALRGAQSALQLFYKKEV